jgi:polysaccharide pyruvyl transferase WcaK-like protein
MIGEEFHRPDSIDKLVVTAPQARRYMPQAEELVERLSREYSDSNRILSFHSSPRGVDLELAETARQAGWETAFLSHDTDNLEIYRDSDLHIGYRLHGHLAHLRWRRPSIVFAEDSRVDGLTNTFGTGGVRAYETRDFFGFEETVRTVSRRSIRSLSDLLSRTIGAETMFFLYHKIAAKTNSEAVDAAIEFADEQMERGWPAMEQIREVIDSTYRDGMKPYMEAALPE